MWTRVSKLIKLQMTYVFLRETQKNKLEKVESLNEVYTYHIHYLHMFIWSKFGYVSGSSVREGLDGWVGVIWRTPPSFSFSHKNPNNSHLNALTPKEIKKVGEGGKIYKKFLPPIYKDF